MLRKRIGEKETAEDLDLIKRLYDAIVREGLNPCSEVSEIVDSLKEKRCFHEKCKTLHLPMGDGMAAIKLSRYVYYDLGGNAENLNEKIHMSLSGMTFGERQRMEKVVGKGKFYLPDTRKANWECAVIDMVDKVNYHYGNSLE